MQFFTTPLPRPSFLLSPSLPPPPLTALFAGYVEHYATEGVIFVIGGVKGQGLVVYVVSFGTHIAEGCHPCSSLHTKNWVCSFNKKLGLRTPRTPGGDRQRQYLGFLALANVENAREYLWDWDFPNSQNVLHKGFRKKSEYECNHFWSTTKQTSQQTHGNKRSVLLQPQQS